MHCTALCVLYLTKTCAGLSLLNSRRAQTQQLFPKLCLCQNQRSELPTHPLVCTNKTPTIYLSFFNNTTKTCWLNQLLPCLRPKIIRLPTVLGLMHTLEISQVAYCSSCNILQQMFSDLQLKFLLSTRGVRKTCNFWCQKHLLEVHTMWIKVSFNQFRN